MPRALALVIAVALPACVHRVECTAHGGPEWHEATTGHFVVQSDLPLEETKAEANRLELLRATERWFFKLGDEGEDVTRVIVLRDDAELKEFARWRVGYAWWTEETNGLVLSHEDTSRDPLVAPFAIASHELAHRYAAWALVQLPTWLNEGIAEYLSTIQLLPERRAKVGMVGNLLDHFFQGLPMGLDELWSFETTAEGLSDDDRSKGYASSWAWVHFLANTHTPQWNALLSRLQKNERPRQAFEAEFPPATWPGLREELNEYLHHARYGASLLQLGSTSTVQDSRAMAPWEVHLVRRQLWDEADTVADAARAQQKHTEAVAAELLAPPPTPWPVSRELAVDEKRLSKEAALHPEVAEAQYILGGAETDDAKAAERLREAARLDPRDPDAQRQLGLRLGNLRQFPQAHAALDRATALAGWDPRIAEARSVVAAQEGNCPEALAQLDRALAMLGDRATTVTVKAIARLRAQVAGSCHGPPAPK